VTSISGVDQLAKQEINMTQAASRAMEATCSSEKSPDFHLTARSYIPEDITLHKHGCENHKYYKIIICGVYARLTPLFTPTAKSTKK
jgi:hypothetical protein